jgi:hypothetical protein
MNNWTTSTFYYQIMFSSLFLPELHTNAAYARCAVLACVLFASAALTACGGGGASPSADMPANTASSTPPNTASSTPPNTSTSAPVNANPSSPAGASITTTTPATGNTPTSSAGGSVDSGPAAYNSCADTADINDPSNANRETYQRYVLGGLGDGFEEFTTPNRPVAAFKGAGAYIVRSVSSLSVLDGIALPNSGTNPGGGGGGAPESIDTVSFYARTNGVLGLVGSEIYTTSSGAPTLQYSYSYDPIFYDRRFTLSTVGQTAENTKTGSISLPTSATTAKTFAKPVPDTVTTTPSLKPETSIRVVSEKITYLGLETIRSHLGGSATYNTCKLSVRKLDATDALVTTEWYLVGKGVLMQSVTVNAAGQTVSRKDLERARVFDDTVFPGN